ncbi:MipA/OmpV family protein [Hydrogenophaga sp.]|uniref:MipA/OmpV family protein n=1 Tax=Hydrogenophaga sp. TaxID=1904254 RepID=UPI002736C0D9|nr:MipA/OmpV family protein [Hydrogenophaga sp.]
MPNFPALPSLTQVSLIAQAASALSIFGGARVRSNRIDAMEGDCPSEHDRRDNTAVTPVTAMQAVLAATFLALCPPVHAQSVSQEPTYGLSGRIGLNAVSMRTYEGSPNTRTLAAPDLTLSYRSRDWGTVEFGQRGLIWNAVEAGRFRFDLVAQFDPGRKDKDTSALNPTPGDKRLAGMGSVKSSTEAGVGIGYGPVMVVARQSLSERGAKGAQVDMTVEHSWPLSDRLGLRVAHSATWANRDYMQTYFGVTAAQAQATQFSVYTPKSGLRKVEVSVGAEYAVAPKWKLQANLAISHLGDVAAKSPLVGRLGTKGSDDDRRFGGFVALGMAYEF